MLALTGPTGQPSDRLKPLSFLLSSASWKADYYFVWIFPPWDLEKLQHTRVNILDLKILQVFFKNRGEILVFEKMLNFLSFLVLLYVSGHSKQKKNFQNFSENFTSVFQNQGENFIFEKNVEFLEFLGFTLRFRKFQANFFFSKFFWLIEKFPHQFT